VFAFDGPPDSWAKVRLAASAQRAAATIEVQPEDGDLPTTRQMVTGPALGPWTAVAPPTSTAPFPVDHQVDGERVFTSEVRGSGLNQTVVVRDPDPHDIAVRGRDAAFATFAGDLMAYATAAPGDREDDSPRRLVIAEWRTGTVRRTVDLPRGFTKVALRPDGRVALAVDDPGTLYDVRPGHAPRRFPVRAENPQFAGDHIVFTDIDTDRPSVIDPDGTVRPFGLPTQNFGGFVTDDRHVLWVANGCLLVAPVTARATRTLGPGPCPRSEVQVFDPASAPRLARTIPVRLQCIAAPKRCTGKVNLIWTRGDTRRITVKVTAGTRFAVPFGQTRTVRVRLSDAGLKRLRTYFRRHTRATLAVEPETHDGSKLSPFASNWMEIRK
jgi:hypothetical protein